MENNLENKARFFALYWGQLVLMSKAGFQKTQVHTWTLNFPKEEHSLELTPLSQISDEDALEVCKLAIPYTGRYELLEKRQSSIIFKLPFICSKFQIFPLKSKAIHLEKYKAGMGTIEVNDITPIVNSVEIIDYLRSKGYALPFMGLSVEKQIEYGWVKITTK